MVNEAHLFNSFSKSRKIVNNGSIRFKNLFLVDAVKHFLPIFEKQYPHVRD